MEIVKDFDYVISIDDILRGEGSEPSIPRARRPALLKAASDALEVGLSILNPIALTHEIEIVEHAHDRIVIQGGKILQSSLVANHFSGAERIVFVICTIGHQLETFSSISMQENPLLGLALDGLGNAAVEMIAQQVCIRIGEQKQASGLNVSTPISPGEPDWPVEEGQPLIFSILDSTSIGITISSAGMMLPRKSLSFAVGVGKNVSQKEMCNYCSYSEKCHYRHA